MKTAPAIIAPLLAGWLTGCVGVLPVPPPRNGHGQVAASKFVSLSGYQSLTVQLEDWASGNTHHFADTREYFINSDNGDLRLIEYVRQTGQFRAGP